MKKQMLILKGPGSTGKSTTIKLAFDIFLQWAVQKRKASTVHYLYLTKREVAAVIEFENGSIGIATKGDSEKQVKNGLTFFASRKCKVVVCATRSKGKPLKAAHDFASTHPSIIPTELPKPNDKGVAAQHAANIKIAKQLVRWLKSACRQMPNE
jgi:hypothetical protein